jgi:hypothetical protein
MLDARGWVEAKEGNQMILTGYDEPAGEPEAPDDFCYCDEDSRCQPCTDTVNRHYAMALARAIRVRKVSAPETRELPTRRIA